MGQSTLQMAAFSIALLDPKVQQGFLNIPLGLEIMVAQEAEVEEEALSF